MNQQVFFGMDKSLVGGLKLTEQTLALLGNTAMASSLLDTGNVFGDRANPLISRCSSVEDNDDDVVFVESIQPPSVSASVVADKRTVTFTSSKNEKPQGNYSLILPSSRDLASQKGNTCETIVIDDEEDILETPGGEEKRSSNFIEWGLLGTKNKDLNFSTSRLSRSKTKTGVGPFNPGRMNVAGGVFQSGGFATHHNPEMNLPRRLLLFP
ncbi:zinc finger MYM-type protein 5 isoform X3 [Lepus europaeus]|uniref:zinc finger MYM-type protein 5 isoform X3 n=1 Tax=Lepus europaeus TaxID=9983 RepID=UPI002B497718|nr:zinc finger MYM-type protein 5 isoform X3 [Lepus europaeus]